MSNGIDAQDGSNDELREYIREILTTKSKGESTKSYDVLINTIRNFKRTLTEPTTSRTEAEYCDALKGLVDTIHALSRCISSIHERRHEILLTSVLDIPLWSCPVIARRAVLEFIMHAVVAHGALVQTCCHTIVYSLLPPPQPPIPDPCPGETWHPLPEQASIQDDVLETAERILELVPTSATRLLPLLASNMPHKLRERNIQCLYFRALFRLAESASGAGIREGILVAIVEHVVSIDVDIRWEQIVDVVTEETKEEEGGHVPGEEEPDIFELEGMSEFDLAMGAGADALIPGGGWEGARARGDDSHGAGSAAHGVAAHGSAQQQQQQSPPPPVDETADKLDSLMELTMEHLSKRIASGQLPVLWDTCMACFDRLILHTHRSKFTQFLMFYLASHSPMQCCRSFMHLLLSRLMDRTQAPVTRSACASYAASFLARADFAPEAIVIESLHRIAEWCIKYTREEDRRGGLAPIPSAIVLPMMMMTTSQDARDRHAAFYAACQAMLYVLCYHMEPLLKNNGKGYEGKSPRVPGQTTEINTVAIPHINSRDVLDTAPGVGGNNAYNTNNGGYSNGGNNTAPAATTTTAAAASATSLTPAISLTASIQSLFAHELPYLLSHPLDPLSSCARSVALEFGRQAGSLGHPEIMQLVMEWERRHHHHTMKHSSSSSSKHPSTSAAAATRPLEVFFPFDPYLLRRSASNLRLQANYVRWRGGHPTAGNNGDRVGGDSDDDHAMVGASDEDDRSSGLDEASDSSSDDGGGDDDTVLGTSADEDDEDEDVNNTSSDEDSSSTSSEDTDDLRRTRFGSMPDSSLSSGGRYRRRPRGKGLPKALKASLYHGSGGSPTMGMPIPGGSLSTDNGSPWGLSPGNGGGFSFAPMSMTPGR